MRWPSSAALTQDDIAIMSAKSGQCGIDIVKYMERETIKSLCSAEVVGDSWLIDFICTDVGEIHVSSSQAVKLQNLLYDDSLSDLKVEVI